MENPVAIADAVAASLMSTPLPPTHSSCTFVHSGFRRRLTHPVSTGGFDWYNQRISIPLQITRLSKGRVTQWMWEIVGWGLSSKVASFFTCNKEGEPHLPLAVCLPVMPRMARATVGWELESDWMNWSDQKGRPWPCHLWTYPGAALLI